MCTSGLIVTFSKAFSTQWAGCGKEHEEVCVGGKVKRFQQFMLFVRVGGRMYSRTRDDVPINSNKLVETLKEVGVVRCCAATTKLDQLQDKQATICTVIIK